jgi:hypothetical protein
VEVKSRHAAGGAVMVAVAGTVYINAALSEQFCVAHPLAVGCEDRAALRPEFPHGGEPTPIGPNGPNSFVFASTSASVSALTGSVVR